MSAEDNEAIIRRWIKAYNERDRQTEADLLAPGYVAHVPGAPEPLVGLEAWTQFSLDRLQGFFRETGLPPNYILGNSEGGKGLWHQKSVLNQKRYTLLVGCNKIYKTKGFV